MNSAALYSCLPFQFMTTVVIGFVLSHVRCYAGNVKGVMAREEVGFPSLKTQDYATNILLMILSISSLFILFSNSNETH